MFAGFAVAGLKRKSKNGTAFYIQKKDNDSAPKGYANIVKTIRGKPGQGDTIIARLQGSGTEFRFRSTDKLSWPNAQPKQ